MGARNVGRAANVSINQTQPNLSGSASPELRIREGLQQKGPNFERFMQGQTVQRRALAEQLRRSRSPFG